MDSFSVETSSSWSRIVTLSYLDGEIDDDQRQAVLNICNDRGERWVRIGLDFTAAGELMVWLNTNIHRLMVPADQPLAPNAGLTPGQLAHTENVPDLSLRDLRVRCAICSRDAINLSWPSGHESDVTVRCPAHVQDCRVGLPVFTDLQLYMLSLVDRERGLSTSDYANQGGASWTVRGTGNVLYRLERAGMVAADRRARPRRWQLTPHGAAVAPYIQNRRQI